MSAYDAEIGEGERRDNRTGALLVRKERRRKRVLAGSLRRMALESTSRTAVTKSMSRVLMSF